MAESTPVKVRKGRTKPSTNGGTTPVSMAIGDSKQLDRRVFRRFCALAREHGGIALKPGKEALVSARVAKRQRALGLTTPKEYLRFLEADESGFELRQFLDVITTNVTSFFREATHLDELQRHVRQLVAAGVRRIRLWSAACSSGEEAYSMAIVALEACEGVEVDLKLLATDISSTALERAEEGVYTERRVQTVSRPLRTKYFERLRGAGKGEDLFRVRPALKDLVVFKRLNLARPPFPMRGPLDVIFCRNVMIYLDYEIRRALLAEMDRLLADDGLLMLGHSESLTNMTHPLRNLGPSIYGRVTDVRPPKEELQ